MYDGGVWFSHVYTFSLDKFMSSLCVHKELMNLSNENQLYRFKPITPIGDVVI